MAFVQQSTADTLGNRAFSLRGMGAEPVRVFYTQEQRTLRGMGQAPPEPMNAVDVWNPIDIILPAIDVSRIPSVLLNPPLQPIPVTSTWTDWFRQESIVPKVPNWALAGLGGMLLLAFMPTGGTKRRRR